MLDANMWRIETLLSLEEGPLQENEEDATIEFYQVIEGETELPF